MSKYDVKPLGLEPNLDIDPVIHKPKPEVLRTDTSRRDPGAPWWSVILLACISLFLLIIYVRAIWGPLPDGEDVVTIDFDGTAVLVLEDEQSNPRQNYSSGQTASLGAVEAWAYDNVDQLDGSRAYRALDVNANMKNLNPFWTKFKDEITEDPPVAAVLKGNKFLEFKLSDVETTKRNLEKFE